MQADGSIHPDDMDSTTTDMKGPNSVVYKERDDGMESSPDEKHDDNDDDENDQFHHSHLSRFIEKIEDTCSDIYSKHKRKIKNGVWLGLLVAYFTYFLYCMYYRFGDEGSVILLIVSMGLVVKLIFQFLGMKGIHLGLPVSVHSFLASKRGKRFRTAVRYLLYIAALISVATYLAIDVLSQNIQNIRSFFGMLGLIFLCFILSAKHSRVNWHPVFWSFIVQFVVAAITLRTEFGYNAFKWLGDQVQTLFHFADEGSRFVIADDFGEMGIAFKFSGVIMFTNALVFLLNHWGVIEFIVLKLGWFLSFCLDTGPVESVVAAANIFLGLVEAPLMVRPYMKNITKSELHTIMTCGFASIAGGIMALFIRLGAPANHLLTAAVISAPAALGISKLIYPETQRVSLESQKNIKMVDEATKKETNALNAYSEGAVMGLAICGAIWSNMLTFISLLGLLDALVNWFGQRAGVDGLTFEVMFSYLLMPVSYMMGVDSQDCLMVGSLIGIKLFATPVVGYTTLGEIIENRRIFEDYMTSSPNNTWHWSGNDVILEASNVTLVRGIISERSEVITTYAMCGFSAFTAVGITLGALIPLCPSRKLDIVNLVVSAFVAGNMASFATGAVAGILFSPRNETGYV